MAKLIKYQFLSCEVPRGSGGNASTERIILEKRMLCPTPAAYALNYPIAEAEAVGSITVEGEFDSGTQEADP